jgi:hypothetical protein
MDLSLVQGTQVPRHEDRLLEDSLLRQGHLDRRRSLDGGSSGFRDGRFFSAAADHEQGDQGQKGEMGDSHGRGLSVG